MSTHSTFLTPELNDYLARLFSAEDNDLRRLQELAAEAKIPAISIAPEQTSFLQLMISVTGARRVLEIGSLAGYSALTMAKALPQDGQLLACEIDERFADFIEARAREAGLDHIINVCRGPALTTIASFTPEDQFDVVFIDADKPNYVRYLEAVLPHVRLGGVVIGDNCLAWGHVHEAQPDYEPSNVTAIAAFNDRMSTHPALRSTLVPLGDGMTVGVKIREI